MAQPLPVEILLGIYLGVLTGIFPALVAWGLGFLFKYLTGVSLPAFGVVVLALALAGINGGLLALSDPTVVGTGPRIVVALLVVLLVSIYAHAKGDQMGAEFPRRLSLKRLRERTLSSDVVELVGARGEVTVEVVGEVADVEGHPPLSPETRTAIKYGEWRLPADLPLSELETRFADRLVTELDLADVVVSIDERGRATVAAAPPQSGVSKRVPDGRRAVSFDALVPTGLARGDEVLVLAGADPIQGTVVSARSGSTGGTPPELPAAGPVTDGERTGTDGGRPVGDGGDPPDQTRSSAAAPTTTGGEGRVTVAVARSDVEPLLDRQRAPFVVTARGTHREFELVALLRQAGKRFRTVTIGPNSTLVDVTLGGADVRKFHDVAVLAVKRTGGWTVAPRGTTELHAGDELFVVGRPGALDAFREVAT